MKYAIVSVSDKNKLDTLARGIERMNEKVNYGIISTGGTYITLKEIKDSEGLGFDLKKVEDITGFPEILGGRVKTLHPLIAGGILYKRGDETHVGQAIEHNLPDIDLVVVNFYPFEKAVEDGLDIKGLMEKMDIGGPAMVGSGVKNWENVGVICDPDSYEDVMNELYENDGVLTDETRMNLAAFGMNKVADYRSLNAVELTRRLTGEETLRRAFRKGEELGRYGENWHQKAWRFVDGTVSESNALTAECVHGGELGFNNYVDLHTALDTLKGFRNHGNVVIVIKHKNPWMANGKYAFERAWQGDAVSAFGSIIGKTTSVTLDDMKVITTRMNQQGTKGWFVECMIAPGYTDEALEYIKGKKSKANLRLLAVGDLDGGTPEKFEFKDILGGTLKQTRNIRLYLTENDTIGELYTEAHIAHCDNSGKDLTVGVVTETWPDENRKGLLDFTWRATRHAPSNGIVIVREYSPGCYQIIGLGSGQPNRVDSFTRLALPKALDVLETEYRILTGEAEKPDVVVLQGEVDSLRRGFDSSIKMDDYIRSELGKCAVGSDSFTPFPDIVEAMGDTGLGLMIQSGGAKNDGAVIKTADKYGISMVFTGVRQFKH